MRTKHVDKLVGAYLDDRLSPELRQQVEIHIQICPVCAQRLFDTRRLDRELGPVLRVTLGQPLPPPMLRQKVRQALDEVQSERPFYFNWTVPVRVFNAVGNAALIALLAFGVIVVTRGQIPGAGFMSTSRGELLAELNGVGDTATSALLTPSPVPTEPVGTQASRPQQRTSLGDTIALSGPSAHAKSTALIQAIPAANNKTKEEFALQTTPQQSQEAPMVLTACMPPSSGCSPNQQSQETPMVLTAPPVPHGTIAFALFDPTPGIEMYQIHLINPDGTNHRLHASLKGGSEPALYPGSNDYTLALRSWQESLHPRRLLTGDVLTSKLQIVTHFWEDAQPDWSPTENRIIFASQRESDRRWRLYTAWGDGSLEVNLNREGQSPSFAPDGYRFVFESCDETGNNCGLWLGDLENSQYDSKLFLAERRAKSPDWSPVSEEIAYMANPQGNWDLYLTDSGSARPRRLTDNPAIDGLPAWSPDGEWLAFVSDRGKGWGIWVLHLSTGTLHKTVSFNDTSLIPINQPPYNEHGQRNWWAEQISWGPQH